MKRAKTEKKCKYCHRVFISSHTNKIFCDDKCRYKYWDLKNPRIKRGTVHH